TGPEAGDDGGSFDPFGALGGLYGAVAAALGTFSGLLVGGVETVWTRTDQFVQTFLRSGYVFGSSPASDEAINLSVLESAPILGGLVGLSSVAFERRDWPSVRRVRQPGPATALAVGLTAVVLTLLYVERLPLHAQVTVRYLLALYALGVVALAWLAPVRRAVETHAPTVAWTVAGGVLLGSQLLFATVVGFDLALGEAFQLHALVGLATALMLAASAVASARTARFDRALAVTLGLATAATVVFSVLAVTAYADGLGKYNAGGGQLLPLVRLLADLIGTV
ncbi:MAG: hypothetical protein ACOCPX_07260, partial [Halapricum sp.]